MRILLFHSIYFLLMVVFTTGASGQDFMDTVVHLNEVIIFSQKPMEDRALVASEIDSITIRENNASALDELLSSNSFIYIRSYGYGALSTASFRGASASHTRVFWNDMEINDPASGQVDFSLIPVCFIDEIKLYHGGSSSLRSSGGLGGIIELNSVPAWNEETQSAIEQSIGSFNTWNTRFSLSSGKKNRYYKIKVYRESSSNDFKFTNNANGKGNIERYNGADYRKAGMQGDFYLKNIDRKIFSMHVWLQNSDRNFAPVMSYMGPERKENQSDKLIRWVSRYKYYGDFFQSEISLGLANNEMDYFLKEERENNYIFNTESHSWNIFTRHKGIFKLGSSTRIRTEASLSYKNSQFEDVNMNSGFSVKRLEAGSSFSLHHEFSFPVTTYALVRMDIFGDQLSPLNPTAGIEYSPGNLYGFSIKSTISRNYHFPDLNDLYWIPGGNPGLLPENGYLTDISMEYQLNNTKLELHTSLTVFHSLINNWILWKPGEFGFWKAENIDKVRSRGIEQQFSLNYRNPNLTARISASYSFTKANSDSGVDENLSSESIQLIYTPVHKANMNITLNSGKYKFLYQYLYTGRRFTTTDNDPEMALDPFYYVNLRILRTLELSKLSMELGLGINNLFDSDYQVIRSRPMPGRHFNLLLKLNF